MVPRRQHILIFEASYLHSLWFVIVRYTERPCTLQCNIYYTAYYDLVRYSAAIYATVRPCAIHTTQCNIMPRSATPYKAWHHTVPTIRHRTVSHVTIGTAQTGRQRQSPPIDHTILTPRRPRVMGRHPPSSTAAAPVPASKATGRAYGAASMVDRKRDYALYDTFCRSVESAPAAGQSKAFSDP